MVRKGEIACYKQLLVTSNFSFSHNVFHSYISLMRQNAALCRNGLSHPGSMGNAMKTTGMRDDRMWMEQIEKGPKYHLHYNCQEIMKNNLSENRNGMK